ncbi:cobalamin biosynthesis protein CbiG [Pedobacter sp. UYEF25]
MPILLIAITGAFLSLGTLRLIDNATKSAKVDFDAIKSTPSKLSKDFEFFKSTKLADVQSVEFPFSEDVEDYFIIKTNEKEVAINQVTGDKLAESSFPMAAIF